MLLLKDDALVSDDWIYDKAESEADHSSGTIVDLDHWLENRDLLKRSNRPLGIVLYPGQTLEPLAIDIESFQLIVLMFETFSDGRAYSMARILRDRFGFKGEIRAKGDVLVDQYPLMRQCGFNSFEVPDTASIKVWQQSLNAISGSYQHDTQVHSI